MTIRTIYGERNPCNIDFKDCEPITEQSHKKACDINHILSRYRKTGIIEHTARHKGEYGDMPSVTYHEAMNLVIKAQNSFMELPAEIRKKFDNNAESFLRFVENPDNQEEMRQMGLMEVTHADPPVDPPAHSEPAPAAAEPPATE